MHSGLAAALDLCAETPGVWALITLLCRRLLAGEACPAECGLYGGPSGGDDGRRVPFALRTSVHKLNSMAPWLSTASQRTLCNCCHRGLGPGWRRAVRAVLTGHRARYGSPGACQAARKYQTGRGCCRWRTRLARVPAAG